MAEIPVARSKSALDKIAAIAFSKRSRAPDIDGDNSLVSLEESRKEIQDEISKLTMMISDESIHFNDDEIMEINDKINDLLVDKNQLEKQILRASHGLVNYITQKNTRVKLYFGRAKEVYKQKSKAESDERAARIVSPESVRESSTKEECVQETLRKSHVRQNFSKPKRTRFDDDEDSS
jgi:hypothetical protein